MADSDIEICKNVEPHELVEAVKSKAVVRYSAMQAPATFNRLQCNTNLNLPPSNWLTSAGSYGLHKSLYQVPGFSSFRLAHMFPDCVSDVDVVSDAENVKKLLKLSYSPKGVISMLVHKVGNSLLLDEFDIQKYLMRRSDDDWNWLRNFILEQLLACGGEPNNFCLKDKSREAIQSKNLLSKFLYYSLKQSLTDTAPAPAPAALDAQDHLRPPQIVSEPILPEPKIEEKVPDPQTSQSFNRNVLWTFEDIRMLIGTDMPIFGGPNRPCISLRLRDMNKPINVLTGIDYWLDNLMCNVPEVVMCYHLDGLVQKYEIIKTEDLPYLEDSKFSPQVVRNMAHNILSFLKANATKEGHTYWLFKARNDDVVKLYDLTTLCKNETPTSKQNKREDEKPENPFTVPVAMLLYSVARNIKNTTQHVTPKVAGNIKALLENTIKLLPREKYPQIITSSHYILSDLYIPDGLDPKCPNFECDVDFETDSVYEDDDGSENSCFEEELGSDASNNVVLSERNKAARNDNIAVGRIAEMTKYTSFEKFSNSAQKTRSSRVPLPLMASVEERCHLALEHINAGISCLQFFNKCEDSIQKENEERAKQEEKEQIIREEQNPTMAKPYKPIALPYESLKSESKANLNENNSDCNINGNGNGIGSGSGSGSGSGNNGENDLQPNLSITDFGRKKVGSWTTHLKLLLVEKASLVYATLAEQNYMTGRYGACLKAIHMSCLCQEVLVKHMSNIVSQKSCLLGRAGDSLFQLAKNFNSIDESIAQYNESTEIDERICFELEKDLPKEDISYIITPTKDVENLMLSSCKCYDYALSFTSDADEYTQQELLRRLGNVSNELGLKYMYWAQDEFNKYVAEHDGEKKRNLDESANDKPKEQPLHNKLAMKSYDSLMRGIAAFSVVNDKINLAFLYCNMGRYMRFRAHLVQKDEFSLERQKMFYEDAFEYYEKAKDTLGSRKKHTDLWDMFNWELSTATFMLATLLSDLLNEEKISSQQWEKVTLEYLQKALKLCDFEHMGPRQVLYICRSGLIHKHIAAFHFGQMRRLRSKISDTSSFSRTTLQLCKIHYEKAITIFESLHEASDLLTTHMDRITLQEVLAEYATQPMHKIKHLQTALDICRSAKTAFRFALDIPRSQTKVRRAESIMLIEEFLVHAEAFEKRLQNILKTLIKLQLQAKDPKKRVDLYKKMYMEALKCKKSNQKAEKNDDTVKNILIAENDDSNDDDDDDDEIAEPKSACRQYFKDILSLLESFDTMIDEHNNLPNSSKK